MLAIRKATQFLAVFICLFSLSAHAVLVDKEETSTSNVALITKSAENKELAKVNLNTANAVQLADLKGIGTAKAQAILEYRAQHGAFKSVEELKNVKGFSDKIVANLLKKNPERMVVD